METRSSRSRSRTPFVQTTLQPIVVLDNEENHIIEKTVIKHSYSTRNSTLKSSNSSLSEEVFESPVATSTKQKSHKTTRSRHKTSDYSSEEAESEVSSTKGNGHTKSHLKKEKSHKNGEAKSALQIYKEAGEYWNKYPKTDYTYSIHSKDRVELAPGVVAMPNMSRRSLRRSTESNTSVFSNHQQYSDTSEKIVRSNYRYDHNTNFAPKTLFREEIDSDTEFETHEKVTKISIFRRFYQSFTSVFTRIMMSVVTILSVVSQSSIKPVLWIGRNYYKAVSRLLLFDTWLLQSSSATRRWGPLIALMLLPLILLTGLHLAQAHDVPLVPNCYPHCGRIAIRYFNSFIDTFYSAENAT